jgi:hypothetical protein
MMKLGFSAARSERAVQQDARNSIHSRDVLIPHRFLAKNQPSI